VSAPRVMVVDDCVLNNELVSFLLNAAGFEWDTAQDAYEAQRKLPSFQPELILMDIQMPGMSGLELTQLLKADAATRHIVIVAFTAYAMKDDEAKLLEAGCDGYISKPIDVSTFVQSVRNYLPRQPV
jgi:two-component system, cell cycle response regulator DivK